MKRHFSRLTTAALVSPAVPGALLILISLAGRPREGIWLLQIALPIGYLAMLLLGIPLHLLFRHLRLYAVWIYLLAGFICGIAPAVIIFWEAIIKNLSGGSSASSWSPFVGFAIFTGTLGLFAAWVFWLIARPDRNASPS